MTPLDPGHARALFQDTRPHVDARYVRVSENARVCECADRGRITTITRSPRSGKVGRGSSGGAADKPGEEEYFPIFSSCRFGRNRGLIRENRDKDCEKNKKKKRKFAAHMQYFFFLRRLRCSTLLLRDGDARANPLLRLNGRSLRNLRTIERTFFFIARSDDPITPTSILVAKYGKRSGRQAAPRWKLTPTFNYSDNCAPCPAVH